MRKYFRIALTALLILLICMIPVQAASAQKTSLNKTKASLYTGKSLQLKVKGTTDKVTWKSSNTKVAKVSSTGKVTALKAGKATITAKVDNKSLTCKITVKAVTISKKKATLMWKDTLVLKVNGASSVKWSSSNPQVARVGSKGKVTAREAGKATITATAGKKSYTCIITVKKPVISVEEATMIVNDQLKLKVRGESSLKWSSSDPQTAKVGSKGKVTALKAGTATIKASSGQRTYSCSITVKEANISQTEATLVIGGEPLILSLENVSLKSASSSDSEIASVTDSGIVTALKKGSCTITLTDTEGRTYKCEVTVTEPEINMTSKTMHPGETVELKLNDGAVAGTWSSSDEKVATVDENGVVTAVAEGNAIITGEVLDLKFSCTIEVVKAVPDVTPTPTPEATPTSAPEVIPTITPEVIPTSTPEATPTPTPEATPTSTPEATPTSTPEATPTPTPGEPDQELTRGEWIKSLLEKAGHNFFQDSEITTYYFADSAESPYGLAAEAAHTFGILPDVTDDQDVPMFHPDDPATREFVAYTAVMAAGFDITGVGNPPCSDVDEIENKQVVTLALNNGMLSLIDGKFEPAKTATTNEQKQIFKVIDDLNASTIVDENYNSTVDYNTEVVQEPLKNPQNYVITPNGSNSYNVTIGKDNIEQTITEGKVFILPANAMNESEIALKATEVSLNERGETVINAIPPENIAEVYSSIDFEGIGIADINHIQPAEGITFNYIPPEGELLGASLGGSISVPGKLEFTIPGTEHSLNDAVKIEGKFTVEIPDITLKVNADVGWSGIKVKDFISSITGKVTVEGGIYVSAYNTVTHGSGTIEKVSNVIELGRVPLKTQVPGLTVDLILSMYYEASGEFTVQYSLSTTGGYQYSNGVGRVIKDFHQDFTPLTLSGTAGVGLQFGVNAVALKWFDLVGVDFRVGPEANASVEWHPNEQLLCADARIYLAASLNLTKDTAVGKFLDDVCHLTLSWQLLKNDSSNVLRWGGHFENLKYVDECTYGSGEISGGLFDAETLEPIKYAQLTVLSNGLEVGKAFTDENGLYLIKDLKTGTYQIKATATNYQAYTSSSISVESGKTTYAENFLMVRRDSDETGFAAGSIIDARSGESLSDVSFQVRAGWENITGEIIAEGSVSGAYNIELNPGNYTIAAQRDGYIDAHVNVAVTAGNTTIHDIGMNPASETEGDGLTIILTWGYEPSDLDSHLYGPTSDTSENWFHTYYVDKDYTEYDSDSDSYVTVADLDLDDVTSYGPETTTIRKVYTGRKYSFFVHDYSNRYSSDSSEMSLSGAKVEVYQYNTKIRTYNVPVNTVGTVWHVFDYDPVTKTITSVNTMTSHEDPDSVGQPISLTWNKESISLEEELRLINSVPEKNNQAENAANEMINIFSDTEENVPEENQSEQKEDTEIISSEEELPSTADNMPAADNDAVNGSSDEGLFSSGDGEYQGIEFYSEEAPAA